MSGAGDKLGFARRIINKRTEEALIRKFCCSLTKGALLLPVGPRVLLTGAADIYQEQAPVERRGGLRSAENPPACVLGGLGTNGRGPFLPGWNSARIN
ncbi:uncharacterized protein CDAR_468281 [Caerostris darwini]|uniref:Uncharacterized protein n=1 Tax=Caerostris darwini TaxID=1538125 RepID=A0AAV4WXL2_9ARAC|nr:uncharacterized protein CDAR_468281 [Caerostris darwini]